MYSQFIYLLFLLREYKVNNINLFGENFLYKHLNPLKITFRMYCKSYTLFTIKYISFYS